MLDYRNAPEGMTGRPAVVAVADVVVKEGKSNWE
jgi:hypothetical protein